MKKLFARVGNGTGCKQKNYICSASGMEKRLSVNHLLGIRPLTPSDIGMIFSAADEFKDLLSRPIKKVPALRDLAIANVFFENSTRTRLSFELAQKRLSADVVNFSASSSSVSKGETLTDTVRNILAMKVDMVVMRHPLSGAAGFLAERLHVPVINAGDGTHEHPTQALLDAYTIRQNLGDVSGKKVLIVGDILHSRVALSNILCLQKLGASVRVCGPSSLMPTHIRSLGVEVSYSLMDSLAWCDVVNMLRIQHERQDLHYFPGIREYSSRFGLNAAVLKAIDKPLLIMHPGPINRGVEITAEVADGPHSVILDQVENGVAIRMAVIFLLSRSARADLH